MSLRDFNAPSTDDPTALHNAPLGNGSGLDSFHTRQPEDIEPSNIPKIVGAVAVALMVGAAGVALYSSAGKSIQPKPMVTASNLPATPPTPPPAATPAPDANMAANAPVNTPPVSTPPAEVPAASTKGAAIAPAPVKAASTARKHVASQSRNGSDSSIANSSNASAASARMAADSSQVTNQPQQQATVAQPAAPTPSPSDLASNNTQSGAAVPQGATTASDIPVTPTAPNIAAPQQNNTAAPQETQASTPQANNTAPAQPAPAQSAGQVNQ
jgi:hypothetical protein